MGSVARFWRAAAVLPVAPQHRTSSGVERDSELEQGRQSSRPTHVLSIADVEPLSRSFFD
jgi:hypothetical protein